MLSQKKINALIQIGLLVGLGYGLYCLLNMKSSSSSNTAPNANMNRQVMKPHNAYVGQKNLGDMMSCPRKQMNKLSDCDSNTTPNYGENWMGYIQSQ